LQQFQGPAQLGTLPVKSEADSVTGGHGKLLENEGIDPDERSLNLLLIAFISTVLFQTWQP